MKRIFYLLIGAGIPMAIYWMGGGSFERSWPLGFTAMMSTIWGALAFAAYEDFQ